ncbi:MAG: GNAT family N-acetyltransferase [Armatimonadetes bacterium]|nr:GNAT family N-acetyltransferase [Armatimonadota bacterium]
MSADLPVSIRPFDPARDYERIAEIATLCYPDHPETADELRDADARRDMKYVHRRHVAESEAGTVVGFGRYDQDTYQFHPRRFGLSVEVHPDYRKRGVGTRLYDHLVAELEKYQPVRFRAYAREDKPDTVRFVVSRGYEPQIAEWESYLLPQDFDSAPFAAHTTVPGVTIRSLRELQTEPNYDRRLCDLDAEVSLDMPGSEPTTTPSFADWRKQTLDNPNLLPDGYFVAVDDATGAYIGLSVLWKRQADRDLYTGATGVLPAYRRRGIALTLKLRALTYAKATGAPKVRTWNAQVNRAMLAINERLGFVKEPAWIEYGKTVRPEPFAIRQATPRDYHAIAHVFSEVWHEFPETADELRHGDETRSETVRHNRFLAEVDGKTVAVGEYGQHLGAYDPRKFDLHVAVLPEYQKRGIGKAMYEHLLAALVPFAPHTFTAYTLSDRERAVRFLADRGFDLVQTEQTSKLDPQTFAPAPYAPDIAKVEAQGIVIRPYAAWRDTISDLSERLHELHWIIGNDVPHTEERTRVPLTEFVKRFDDPRFLQDGAFYAFDTTTNEFVGMSLLWGSGANSDLHTGTTGVLRSHRKRGIATALKVHALTFAKERGSEGIWTSNEVGNTGMLGINARFGFEKQPEELQYQKRIPTNE